MHEKTKILALARQAFISSLPVMMGYLAMGGAAGVLLAAHSGIKMPALWAFLTSATSISGALQFMMVDWIHNRTPMLNVALLTLCLNFRYAMYGLSLLERFRGISIFRKLYLIWAMTDETYALEVQNHLPKDKSILYCLMLACFNHSYWIIGVTAGAIAGSGLPFSDKGIDFAMTALFIVILVDQCRTDILNRRNALIGGGASVVCLLIFGASQMLIPSIILMITVFIIFRKKFETKEEKA